MSRYNFNRLAPQEIENLREQVIEVYITENHTKQESAELLGMAFNRFRCLLTFLGLQKPTNLSDKARHRRQVEGSLEKYGVSNPMQVPEIAKKSRDYQRSVFISKYGVTTNLCLPEVQEKARKASSETLRPEREILLANQKRETSFREKYGVSHAMEYISHRKTSNMELKIQEYLRFNSIRFEANTRKYLINPDSHCRLELDLYLPDYKLGIEYNSTKFHSSGDNTPLKEKLCRELGIRLLVFNEEEFPSLDTIIVKLKAELGIKTSTVSSIEILDTPGLAVYDIEVPDYHNFVLDNGIVVHNSVDSIQQFKLQGFNSYTLSVDRSRDPYTSLRNAVNEGRLIAPKIELLEAEYADVEDDPIKNKIDHTPTGCLLGNTMILTWKGKKAIKDLTEDEVLFSFYKDTLVSSRFKNLRVTKYINSYLRITTSRGQVIECTPEHPVLASHGFMIANNLHPRTSIVTIDENYKLELVRVTSKEVIQLSYDIPVYDIEVPMYSNFVLANGLIVHNSKDVLDSIAANIFKASSYEAPPVTSNTATNLLDINYQEEEEDLENWILPTGMTVVEF